VPWHTSDVHRRHPASTFVAGLALAVLGTVAAGCGDDDASGGDAERFCGEIQQDIAAVVSPTLTTEDDLDELLARYRELGDLAPLAVEGHWAVIVRNVETASTVVPTDPASVQRAVAQAYATERSAVAVQRWLLANCGIDIGPVATITPQDPVRPTYDDDVNDSDDDGDTSDDTAGE
jgi:hypothetical protein